ncbi:CBS domain containing protein [Thermodesulfatator indicus DSM 15286]|uniref:CBS domain containing protein n=1 Tax=Thermodesulfatator indicus (strain DSM 15286 / JCM 11887 / CIR29812) TaxID=667014 RepID=F8A9J7_THEID|nr:CBS domain-containing protein [Thermodesulfatator indicus]AEH45223.1 CBS domain containing protein [Thermodesulfatator indicus DSM 15286]
MRIKHWMIKDVITISPEATVEEALQLMKKHSIRHLPVVDGEDLVGLVTESSIRQYTLPSIKDSLPIKEVMILNPITVDAEATIDEAARLIHRHKIGGLPVIQAGKLVGIITVTDLLEAFIELMGILRSSSRIDVIPAKNKSFEEVLDIIKTHGGHVISVGMDIHPSGEKIYYVRLEKCPLDPIAAALEIAGHQVVSLVE